MQEIRALNLELFHWAYFYTIDKFTIRGYWAWQTCALSHVHRFLDGYSFSYIHPLCLHAHIKCGSSIFLYQKTFSHKCCTCGVSTFHELLEYVSSNFDFQEMFGCKLGTWKAFSSHELNQCVFAYSSFQKRYLHRWNTCAAFFLHLG